MNTSQTQYEIDNKKYVLDKKTLNYLFSKYINFSDDEFTEHIIDILHYATFICYKKNIPSQSCLSDTGIIHQLIHLAKKETRKYENIDDIRIKFEETMFL
tara:strand:+ start:804 stop:1103 length:300 start_codon:yes stop_codon:yes gene_type:complete